LNWVEPILFGAHFSWPWNLDNVNDAPPDERSFGKRKSYQNTLGRWPQRINNEWYENDEMEGDMALPELLT
jgi:hypothetical protein